MPASGSTELSHSRNLISGRSKVHHYGMSDTKFLFVSIPFLFETELLTSYRSNALDYFKFNRDSTELIPSSSKNLSFKTLFFPLQNSDKNCLKRPSNVQISDRYSTTTYLISSVGYIYLRLHCMTFHP